ncbi:MAG: hypothetical protein ACLQBK_06230 [Candidatus Sulfotelmatobacter sp.]
MLILLAPFYLPLVFALLIHAPEAVEQDQPNAQIIETAQPTDCDSSSGCHYERREILVKDKQGPRTIAIWQRVNDY